MRVPVLTIVAVAMAAAVSTAAPAGAQVFNMTGHWVGKFACKGVDNTGKFSETDNPSTLDITQTGSLIAVSLDSNDFTYNGSLIPDLKKPDLQGEAVLIGCNTNLTFVAGDHSSEIMRAKVKTKAKSDAPPTARAATVALLDHPQSFAFVTPNKVSARPPPPRKRPTVSSRRDSR